MKCVLSVSVFNSTSGQKSTARGIPIAGKESSKLSRTFFPFFFPPCSPFTADM